MSSEMQKQLAILKENFVASLPDKIGNIRDLWLAIYEQKTNEKLEELHRMAHSLAGSGATFDQVNTSKRAKELENYVKDHSAANDIFENKQVDAVNNLIRGLENSLNAIDAEEADNGLDVDDVENMDAMIGNMKIDPMRILLADDDLDSRSQLRLFLTSRGHEVFEAEDGQKAIDIFADVMPDLVIIDVIMPKIAGYEASRMMKEKSKNKFIPIIFLTSISDNETLARCISSGGDDFLTKPVHPIILNSKLMSYQRIRTMYQTLGEYQQKMEEELETSKHVFNSVINNGNDEIEGLSCWASSPGHFSGDTRLFKTLDNGHIYVLLCDFTGHGLPAAIGTVFVADLFRSMTKKSFDAQMIINEVNAKMHQILPTGRYCAAIMLDYVPGENKLTIWNAGLPSGYLVDENRSIVQEFPSAGVPLGVMGGATTCDSIEINTKRGSAIIIYSDGITEAENPRGDMYSEERLLKCIGSTKNSENVFDAIQQDVELFMEGIEPTDDISLVVLDFNELRK